MSATTANTCVVRPVFWVDFHQSHDSGVWTVISTSEVQMWNVRPGSEVVLRDDDGLRFYGRVTEMAASKFAADRWVIEVDGDEYDYSECKS